MMRTLLFRMIFTFSCVALPAAIYAADSGAASQSGKALHDKLCISCHTGMFGGDGSGIYTREDRKVNSLQRLEGQIGACNHNLGFNLSKEQLANIFDHLNQTYYRFKNK